MAKTGEPMFTREQIIEAFDKANKWGNVERTDWGWAVLKELSPVEQEPVKPKPLDHVMSVRMHEADGELIRQQALRLGMRPSEFIRLAAVSAAQQAKRSTTFNLTLNQADVY